MKHNYYKICPVCGAHLDPGEHCDCRTRNDQVLGGKKHGEQCHEHQYGDP